MKSMEEMMAAAQKAAETIQSQMGDAQAKLDSIEVEGTAGGGLVTVKCTARGRILGVSIDESLMKPEEKQMVEDLVAAAFNGTLNSLPRHSFALNLVNLLYGLEIRLVSNLGTAIPERFVTL